MSRQASIPGRQLEQPTTPASLLTPRTAVALGLILLLAITLRLVLAGRAPAFLIPVDSGDFFLAAYQLVQQSDFPLPIKRAPGYPLFLAGAITVVGPDLEAIALLQHLLGVGSVLLAYLIGALTFGRITGLLAALGVAINGGLLLIEQSLMSEALFAPLALAVLATVLLGLRTGRLWWLLLAGLLLGMTALTRSAAQAMLPLAVGAAVLALPGWRQRLLGAGLLALGFALVVTPWVQRNRAVHGVSAISSGLGDALFARTHRHDQGFEFRDRSKVKLEREQARIRNRVFELARTYRFSREVREELQAEFGITPLQADAALRDASLQVIRQEPERYIFGTLEMFRDLIVGFDKELDEFWDTRTRPKYVRDWPETVAFVLAAPDRWTEADALLVDQVTGLYEDYRFSLLVAPLLLLGTLRGLVGWRQGAWLVPAVMASQLLLYVALDGPLFRYRAQLQPLITLVVVFGATWVAARLWTWARTRDLAGTRQPAERREPGARGAPAADPG